MIYIPQIKKRIEELFPRFLQRQLCEEKIQELHTLIDEVVRESREGRSTFVDSEYQPENFLIDLFQPLIKSTVEKFFDGYARDLGMNASAESRKIKVERQNVPTFREWTQYATIMTRTFILGDSTEREDRRDEIQPFLDSFIRGEDRLLFLSNLRVRARIKECMGQVIKDHEFFLNPLPWAEQCATSEGSSCYNPDYNQEKREDLELQRDEADYLIERWENGEFRDKLRTRSELIEYIESYCIDTPLKELETRIAETEQNVHLIGYLFGNKEKKGCLYWRLRDLYKYQIKTSKKCTSALPMDEFQEAEESPCGILIGKESIIQNEFQEDGESGVDYADSIKKLISFGLTEKQSDVFFLHRIINLSFRKIASRKGISPQRVHRLYHKALRKIQSKLA